MERARMINIQEIMDVYSRCLAKMMEEGQSQWDETYPRKELVLKDVENGSLYVAKNDEGQIIGTVVMDEFQEEAYKTVDWQYTEGRIVIFHRLAVRPDAQGKGVARHIQDLMDEEAKQQGYDIVRLDTYSENKRVIKFIEARGFRRAGRVNFPVGEKPFICFEKKL